MNSDDVMGVCALILVGFLTFVAIAHINEKSCVENEGTPVYDWVGFFKDCDY